MSLPLPKLFGAGFYIFVLEMSLKVQTHVLQTKHLETSRLETQTDLLKHKIQQVLICKDFDVSVLLYKYQEELSEGLLQCWHFSKKFQDVLSQPQLLLKVDHITSTQP